MWTWGTRAEDADYTGKFYCIACLWEIYHLIHPNNGNKLCNKQLWKDSKKQAEVIGGHKAYFVVNEVREMIENECAM